MNSKFRKCSRARNAASSRDAASSGNARIQEDRQKQEVNGSERNEYFFFIIQITSHHLILGYLLPGEAGHVRVRLQCCYPPCLTGMEGFKAVSPHIPHKERGSPGPTVVVYVIFHRRRVESTSHGDAVTTLNESCEALSSAIKFNMAGFLHLPANIVHILQCEPLWMPLLQATGGSLLPALTVPLWDY